MNIPSISLRTPYVYWQLAETNWAYGGETEVGSYLRGDVFGSEFSLHMCVIQLADERVCPGLTCVQRDVGIVLPMPLTAFCVTAEKRQISQVHPVALHSYHCSPSVLVLQLCCVRSQNLRQRTLYNSKRSRWLTSSSRNAWWQRPNPWCSRGWQELRLRQEIGQPQQIHWEPGPLHCKGRHWWRLSLLGLLTTTLSLRQQAGLFLHSQAHTLATWCCVNL